MFLGNHNIAYAYQRMFKLRTNTINLKAWFRKLAAVLTLLHFRRKLCWLKQMARPLRLEFVGAVYHVTSRGDRREWLAVLALLCDRFNWVVHAHCQMTNHYHLLVLTVEGNLSAGMQQLNGLYMQRFNRRHGMVESPEERVSRRYPFVNSDSFAPEWLDTDWLLGQFDKNRATTRRAYTKFVLQGCGLLSPLLAVRHQPLLGDDTFIKQHQATLKEGDLHELSIAHKRILALSLAEYSEQTTSRNEAMMAAYRSGAYTMAGSLLILMCIT